MFNLTFILLLLLTGSYLLLRKLAQVALSRRPERREVVTGGLLSWLFVLSSTGLAIWILFLFYTLVTYGALGNIFSLLFIGLAAGFALYLKEVLDASTVWDYVRTTLFFHPYASQPISFKEELDRKKIRDIYEETSQKPFPVVRKEKPLLTDEEVVRVRQEILARKERPSQSTHLTEELRLLSAGSPVDVSDQWKIYTFEHARHDLYERMSGMAIDPSTRTLTFRVDIPDTTERALRDSIFVFHLKQDLYQLLQVLNTDPWLKPYTRFFERISGTCYGIESDSFGLVHHYAFLDITIDRKELLQREGVFFNAADLHKISVLNFNGGKPLQR